MSLHTLSNVLLLPPIALSSSIPLNQSLRQIMADAHEDIRISRQSWWRFGLPTGVGPFVTTYPCEDRIVNDLKDIKAGRKRPVKPYLSIINAAETLCSAHHAPIRNMSLERGHALHRLQLLQSDPGNNIFWSDIILKIFNDLDVALFEGRLTGNVHMRWYMQPDPNCPETRNTAFTSPYVSNVPGGFHDGMRIGISLNGLRLLLDTRGSVEKIVETLVHEMIHAYLLLLADTEKENDCHGSLFQKCLQAVDRTLRQYTGFSTALYSVWAPH
ncbi:MAG: hypothetical protein ASARMPREDX12_006746 [Alectoria sarmentosa]|nr:MAG: hypothetical protein ASARMPREDX12_006746 [Alectoria sarmentosa]